MAGHESAYDLLQEVKKAYPGARGEFMVSRLALRTRLDLESLRRDDDDPSKTERLRRAIREICPDLSV